MSPFKASCNWVGTIEVNSALSSTDTTLVPSFIARARTFKPATWLVGKSSDQISPALAPRALFERSAEFERAVAEISTRLVIPVDPEVLMMKELEAF